MKTNLSFKIFITGLFLSGVNTFAMAQKVQNVQENALWAATPVKVDGKITDEVFQASNKSTLLSYTMSNDDKNLYLVIKSTDNINNNKIMMGGITLTINTDGKKKEKDAYSLTYPLIVRQQGQRGQGGGQRVVGLGQPQRQGVQSGSADSAALARRKQQLATVKEIKVFGFRDIQDSLISIYNEYEILAVAKFDDKGAFVYELAIPLKSLELTNSSKEFAYNIKVNGRQFGGGFGGGNMIIVERPGGGGGQGGRGGFDPSMFLPTDFWGKYTLAKK